jgi:hypothetical protein
VDVLIIFVNHWEHGQTRNTTQIVELQSPEYVMMEMHVHLMHVNHLSLEHHAQIQLAQPIQTVALSLIFPALVILEMHVFWAVVFLQVDVLPKISQSLQTQLAITTLVTKFKESSKMLYQLHVQMQTNVLSVIVTPLPTLLLEHVKLGTNL